MNPFQCFLRKIKPKENVYSEQSSSANFRIITTHLGGPSPVQVHLGGVGHISIQGCIPGGCAYCTKNTDLAWHHPCFTDRGTDFCQWLGDGFLADGFWRICFSFSLSSSLVDIVMVIFFLDPAKGVFLYHSLASIGTIGHRDCRRLSGLLYRISYGRGELWFVHTPHHAAHWRTVGRLCAVDNSMWRVDTEKD